MLGFPSFRGRAGAAARQRSKGQEERAEAVGRAAGGKGGLPFHPCSPPAPPGLSAGRPSLDTSHQTALPWPPPQDPLPETGFVWGRLRGLLERGGRLPFPAEEGGPAGSLPGARRAGRRAFVCSGASGRTFSREKGTEHPFRHFPFAAPVPAPRIPSRVPPLEISGCCQ